MIKLEHITEAMREADHIIGMEPEEHELEFAKYYAGLVLSFIEAAERRETPILSNGPVEGAQQRIMQAVASGWMGADNLGKYER